MGWLAVLGWVLLGLVALSVLLLAVPVELRLRVERAQTTSAELVVGLLAGRWPQRIDLAKAGEGKPPLEEPEPAEPAPGGEQVEQAGAGEGPSPFDRARQGLALVQSKGFLARTGRLLKDVLTSFSVRGLSLWMTVGTGDPADTGQLYGRIQAVLPVTQASRRLDVRVSPDFDRTVFEGGGEVTLQATPIRLAWVVLVYALSPATIRAVHAAWRARPDA